jgi:predicted AlkP superfamily phosphohydrolase/phosphomutase
MSPAKHGVLDFLAWNPETRRRTSVNSTWYPRPTLLDLMAEDGPLLSLKVPMTYPPWQINGWMVSGLPTPDDESAFTYPEELASRLNPLIERGSAGRSWQLEGDTRGIILDQMEAAQRVVERITDHCLNEYTPQSCYVVARDVDELQHFFWDALSGDDQFRYLPRIERYFHKIDSYLGRMLDWAGAEARVIVHSDHGFGPVEGVWHLNDWLHSRGFLALKKESAQSAEDGLSFGLRVNYAIKSRLLRQMKRLGYKGDGLEQSLEKIKFRSQSQTNLDNIDWERTLAYTGNVGEEYLPIFINLQGREPFGSVRPELYEKVRSDLSATLMGNHEPAVQAVHKAEEIFGLGDPRESTAPDLIVETVSGAVQSDFSTGNSQIYEASKFRNGCHRREGMFVLAGPDVEHKTVQASLLDIPTTTLAWMGLEPPAQFEGRVLQDIIPHLQTGKAAVQKSQVESPKEFFSEDEEAGVRKKLESLGYL